MCPSLMHLRAACSPLYQRISNGPWRHSSLADVTTVVLNILPISYCKKLYAHFVTVFIQTRLTTRLNLFTCKSQIFKHSFNFSIKKSFILSKLVFLVLCDADCMNELLFVGVIDTFLAHFVKEGYMRMRRANSASSKLSGDHWSDIPAMTSPAQRKNGSAVTKTASNPGGDSNPALIMRLAFACNKYA